MADWDAEELVNIVGDEIHNKITEQADIDTLTVPKKGRNSTGGILKRSGSDPTSSARRVLLAQHDHPSYQFDYVTSPEVQSQVSNVTDNEGTRARRTRILRPLHVRAVREPRSQGEVPSVFAMRRSEQKTEIRAHEAGAFSPVTVHPDRFLESQRSPYLSQLMSVVQSTDDGLQHRNIHLSRRLPSWMWYLLAKSLGIKLDQLDKPWFATFLHVLTLTIGFLFGITGAWHTVCDILSEYSKTTVLIGTVTMMIGFGWILLGIYAHKLAGKLFSNKNFAESVRMHSKTFLKISTAGLMTFLGFGLVGINAYDGFDQYISTSCTKIQLLPVVCHILYVSKTVYAFVCVSWTMLVGFVLLSVCRTHTIGIRRFMREMMMDSKAYEAFWLENLLGHIPVQEIGGDGRVDDEWFIWDDHAMGGDYDNPVVTSQSVFLESIKGFTYIPTRRSFSERVRRISAKSEVISEQEEYTKEDGSEPEENRRPDITEDNDTEGDTDGNNTTSTLNRLVLSPPIMSNDDLLFSYWKLSRRLVMTSRFLQRWLSSWISFIFCWCAYYIIFWANHNATLTGILQFVFPLLVLLIVCSAYAEVNSEGQRLLKCICPTQSRLSVISFLNQQPLQMQVFSFPITYNAIMGVILAFSVAFASRIVLDEVL